MKKWEYCRLKLIKGTRGGVFFKQLSHDSANGFLRVVGGDNQELSEENILELCLARLGIDGWEVIDRDLESFFLKREFQDTKSVQFGPDLKFEDSIL